MTDATRSPADHYEAGESPLYATDALIKIAIAALEGGLENVTKMQRYAIANTLEVAVARLDQGITHREAVAP